MCTTLAKYMENRWILGKTRDPVPWMRWDDEIKLYNTPADKYQKWIIQNPDINQDGYYGGINENGVAFVATYVPVAEIQIAYIRRPYVRLILDAGTATEAIEIIKAFNPRIGGNMFVADSKECYGVEGAPDKYFIERVSGPAVKTNHYTHLPYRHLLFDSKPELEKWSKKRYERASSLIRKAFDVEGFKKILSDRDNSKEKMAICRTVNEVECFTHSGFIFDTTNKTAYYAQGNPLTTPFRRYNF